MFPDFQGGKCRDDQPGRTFETLQGYVNVMRVNNWRYVAHIDPIAVYIDAELESLAFYPRGLYHQEFLLRTLGQGRFAVHCFWGESLRSSDRGVLSSSPLRWNTFEKWSYTLCQGNFQDELSWIKKKLELSLHEKSIRVTVSGLLGGVGVTSWRQSFIWTLSPVSEH